jgi:hypothetical protein
MAVERPARDARNILVVDDRDTVLHENNVSADKRNVIRLPDVGLAWLFRIGREIAVDAPV